MEMNLHSVTNRTERSRIEQGIRENALALSKINEDRLRLALGLAEFKLPGRLLATRSLTDRSRSGNPTQWDDGSLRPRSRPARFRRGLQFCVAIILSRPCGCTRLRQSASAGVHSGRSLCRIEMRRGATARHLRQIPVELFDYPHDDMPTGY